MLLRELTLRPLPTWSLKTPLRQRKKLPIKNLELIKLKKKPQKKQNAKKPKLK